MTTLMDLLLGKIGRGSDHRDPQLANPVDLAMQLVAALHSADARGRACHDQIARREPEEPGQVGDRFRHLPDQLVQVAFLDALAIDGEPDRARLRMADLG
jgi:hypothetical protein